MLKVGTNILIHPNTTGPGKFGRRLAVALLQYDIALTPGPTGAVFLASSILHPHEYQFPKHFKIVHRLDNTGELYPWDSTQWTPDTKHVQYTYELADAHIFQTEWSAQQFAKYPNLYSKPKDYTVAFNGVPIRELDSKPKGTGILCSICNTWNMTRLYGYIKYMIPHLRQIFSEIPNFKWMVVGKVEPLLEELYNHGLGEFIGTRIIPEYFPANLDDIRTKSDGFIHLLYHDSCPNSVVESVMYSLPGITLNTGAAELIGSGGLSFNAPTGDELSSAIADVLNQNEDRRILTHQYAVNHLDIEKVAKHYADIIHSVT